jgi:hypothetical protein
MRKNRKKHAFEHARKHKALDENFDDGRTNTCVQEAHDGKGIP